MAGIVDRLAAAPCSRREARAEGAEVAVGRRDQRRRPAHDVVAGEERRRPRPRRSSGGRRYAPASPARSASSPARRPRSPSPIAPVRPEARVDPLAAADPPAAASRAIAGDRAPAGSPCASTGAPTRAAKARAPALWSRWAWVTSTAATRSPAHRRRERGEMPRVVGAGVDHRHLALADDVAAGAGEGHRPGVRRGHDPQPGRQPLGHADRRRVVEIEGARGHALPSLRGRRARARNPRAMAPPPSETFLPRSLFGRALTILLVPIVAAATGGRPGLLPAPLPAGHRADDPQRRLRARLRRRARSRPPAPRQAAAARVAPSWRCRSTLALRLRARARRVDARASTATSSTSPAARSPRRSRDEIDRPLAIDLTPTRAAALIAIGTEPRRARGRRCRATGCRSRTRTSSWC